MKMALKLQEISALLTYRFTLRRVLQLRTLSGAENSHKLYPTLMKSTNVGDVVQ